MIENKPRFKIANELSRDFLEPQNEGEEQMLKLVTIDIVASSEVCMGAEDLFFADGLLYLIYLLTSFQHISLR